jgi:Xaa-Pro aminopeptidase
MLPLNIIASYRRVQIIAKDVHLFLAANIFEFDTERSIAEKAHQALTDRGCSETLMFFWKATIR